MLFKQQHIFRPKARDLLAHGAAGGRSASWFASPERARLYRRWPTTRDEARPCRARTSFRIASHDCAVGY